MEPQRPWLSSLCHLAMLINIQLDAGKRVGFDEIYGGLDDGDLFPRLEAKLPGFDAWKLFTGVQGEVVIAALREIGETVRGDERKSLGVEKNGLALLSSLVSSAIQEKLWTDAPKGEPGVRGLPIGN